MKESQNNAPIFIVGSPRSGTSILTWCLGQHPNILPSEESDWIGPLAVSLGVRFATGTARGERSQLSALGVERKEFFQRFGETVNAMLRDHRRHLEANNRASAMRDPAQVSEEFKVSRDPDDPKARWVDGTPEYAFYICGLHKLFPQAKFVHIVRDVRDVAVSLMNFRGDDGSPMVADVGQAYARWERSVRACVQAERALGPALVHRLRYVDLIQRSEAALRDVLEFLGEPFAPACVEPLARRINSSFDDDALRAVPDYEVTDSIAAARQLSDSLQRNCAEALPAVEAMQQFEAGFAEQVEHRAALPENYRLAREYIERECSGQIPPALHIAGSDQQDAGPIIDSLRRMLNVCGVMLILNFLLAAALNLRAIVASIDSATETMRLWLAASVVAVFAYAWLRRAGIFALGKQFLGGGKESTGKEVGD